MLGRVFGVWLSGAITAMALEQVWDSAGPADTGINININMLLLEIMSPRFFAPWQGCRTRESWFAYMADFCYGW